VAKQILIVDDEENARATLADIFKEFGYEVYEARGAEEALRMLDKHCPDVTLIDTQMPDTDGIELCRQIKQVRCLNTKVVVYTGKAEAIDEVRAKEIGVDSYSVKGSDLSRLVASVQKLLNPRP